MRGFMYSPPTLDKCCLRAEGVTLGETASFAWKQFPEKGFSCELSADNILMGGEIRVSELKGYLGGTSQYPLWGEV